MQKGTFTVGLISSILLFIGLILKTFEMNGAGVMMLSAAGTFCFVFVPLLIISNFKKENLNRNLDKWVFAALHLMGITFIIGIILKLMEMSCSTFFIRFSLMGLIFLIMPVYFVSALGTKVDDFYTERRKSQRIIIGVIIMMFVGTLYVLMDLN